MARRLPGIRAASKRDDGAQSVSSERSLGAHPLRRVERVAQAVADEVDAERDGGDHEPREHDEPPLIGTLAADRRR